MAKVPELIPGATSVWAQYTLRLECRDEVIAGLKKSGIPTAIYYPIPLYRQTGYRHLPTAAERLPVSELLAGQVLSLPMHAYLDKDAQERIISVIREIGSPPTSSRWTPGARC